MVEFNGTPLTIKEIDLIVHNQVEVKLSADKSFVQRIQAGVQHLDEMWQKDHVIYGVTTGVGDSCVRPIPENLVPEFSTQLSRFHGCGLGEMLTPEQSRGVLAVRLASLCRGFSAVRYELLERLVLLLNSNILPLIPSEGSVGASGDLTPLSYVAAVVMGEREVYYQGEVVETQVAYAQEGIEPLALRPKECLAIMNGTSVMTALAVESFHHAKDLVRSSSRLTAMLSEALLGNKAHFDPRLFEQKPHPGQMAVAAQIASDIQYSSAYQRPREERIQDTYAIRCAPHIIGVLADALPWMQEQIEVELNSSNDNPLIDPDTGEVLHGGNFYGGHMAFAMDGLKNCIANIADLMDRQMALLVNETRNRGLPVNLTGASVERQPINHAFKAMHIATSAWAAEALKLTMPASVFSRSTESHNQDKVSMGTIAARDCLRVNELTQQVLTATLLAATQALELRVMQGELSFDEIHPSLIQLKDEVRSYSAFIQEDRPLDKEMRQILQSIAERKFQFGEFQHVL